MLEVNQGVPLAGDMADETICVFESTGHSATRRFLDTLRRGGVTVTAGDASGDDLRC